jgi:hypothetical protein
LIVVAPLLASCASKPPPSSTRLSVPALKLAVLDAIGGALDYCDPDVYPVTRGTKLQNAQGRLPTIKADKVTYRAILQNLHITDDSNLTPDQIIAISEAYKKIQSIELKPQDESYAFSVLQTNGPADAGPPTLVEGTITPTGQVTSERKVPGEHPICPVCLAAGVLIATPEGPVRVEDIRRGMPVWTIDGHGRRLPAVVLLTGHMAAPPGHEVVRIVLADGRSVTASPGHPTADGRTVGELTPGDSLDGSRVVSVLRVAYKDGITYDLLPSGLTGAYFADGILLGSTIEFKLPSNQVPSGSVVSTTRQQYQAATVR